MLQGDTGGFRKYAVGIEPQVGAVCIPGFFHQSILLIGVRKEEERVLIARLGLERGLELGNGAVKIVAREQHGALIH